MHDPLLSHREGAHKNRSQNSFIFEILRLGMNEYSSDEFLIFLIGPNIAFWKSSLFELGLLFPYLERWDRGWGGCNWGRDRDPARRRGRQLWLWRRGRRSPGFCSQPRLLIVICNGVIILSFSYTVQYMYRVCQYVGVTGNLRFHRNLWILCSRCPVQSYPM